MALVADATVIQRKFGQTGLSVSIIGLGAGQIGAEEVTEAAAAEVLNGALDLGVTLIDTAASYGMSEERIGRHLGRRRGEFVLSTKGGSGIDGQQDWSSGSVVAGIDQSLRRTRSERLDIYFLHSCPVEVLRRGDLQDAVDAAVAAGKVGVAGYSGDNEHLGFALHSGRFAAIETSVNIVDQWNLRNVVGRNPALGVIAKRPIANAPWRFAELPSGNYAELYWQRLRELALDPGELGWAEFALRFTAYAPGVHAAITGTAKLTNLRRNVEAASQGPLPDAALNGIHQAWQRVGTDWPSST
jgi:aryl-alcohol dehydrogenase-like predicted oxidoreductase